MCWYILYHILSWNCEKLCSERKLCVIKLFKSCETISIDHVYISTVTVQGFSDLCQQGPLNSGKMPAHEITVKPVLSGHSKFDQSTDWFSTWIIECIRPSLSYHLSLRPWFCHSKIDHKLVFKMDYCLMQVKSTAFCNSFDLH